MEVHEWDDVKGDHIPSCYDIFVPEIYNGILFFFKSGTLKCVIFSRILYIQLNGVYPFVFAVFQLFLLGLHSAYHHHLSLLFPQFEALIVSLITAITLI